MQWNARHTVLSILIGINVVSFMDRMVMSVAIPYIAIDFHLNSVAMGIVMGAFFASYSISQIPGGLLADMFGVRRVATIAMLWWSAFTALTGTAANLTAMLGVRFCFGFGEGVYPACAFKTIAAWFPTNERASRTGILLACSMLGSALAPLFAVGIVSSWGWRPVFLSLFVPGVVLAVLFWKFVPDRPSIDHADRVTGLVEAGEVDAVVLTNPPVSKLRILSEPNLWKCFFILFTFDLAYWGFTTWLPAYLVQARGFSMGHMGVAASLPSFAGAVGCVLGGWISERFFSANRRLPIVVTQLLSAFLLYMTLMTNSATMLIWYQTLAGFFLAIFFSTFWALPMTTISEGVIGAASGFINTAGQVAAFASPIIIGYLLQFAGGKFRSAFAFIILSVLISCGIVLTLPRRLADRG